MSQPIRITVIGLGATGLPTAQRLADEGFAVTGVEIDPGRRQDAARAGLPVAEHPTSAATADVVIIQVTTADQAMALIADGLAVSMRPGATLVLMSTVGPEAARTFATQVGEVGALVDAPFTGGVDRARDGELNLFVAGDPATLEPVRPVLAALGNLVDCGSEVGAGQSFKLVNQLLTSVHICAAAEALALADRLGLDPAKAFEAVANGAGRSWLLSDRGPRMLLGADAPLVSRLAIFIKDSVLVADAADRVGLDARLIRAAAEVYARAAELGLADSDDSQVIQAYANRQGDRHSGESRHG